MLCSRWLSRSALVATTLLALACGKPDPGPMAQDPATQTPSSEAAGGVRTTPSGAADKGGSARAVVGKAAPDFELTGLDGAKAKLSDHKGKIVVLEWFNPDCPYVRNAHERGSLKGLAKKLRDAHDGELVWLAVNSNAEGKQGHGDDTNRAGKEKFGIDYPILYDPDGAVGHAYGATNTPHMYVIDKEGTLIYAGALDNTKSGDPEDAAPELVNYVTNALDDLKAARPVRQAQTEAWGCTVKYAKR